MVTPVFLIAILESRGVDLSFLPVNAAISRARPKWLSRSPRFGVISTSRILSAGKRSPIGARSSHLATNQQAGRIVAKVELDRLQSIPSDSTPRSLLFESQSFWQLCPERLSGILSPTL
jgi:hypothetical protein